MDTPAQDAQFEALRQELLEKQVKIEERLWVDSNLGRFDGVMRDNFGKPLEAFAEDVIRDIASLTKAIRGTFFLYEMEEDILRALAGYACAVEEISRRQFKPGEGFVGQAYHMKKRIVLDELEPGSVKIHFSAGMLDARCLLALPLVFNGKVQGVIELIFMAKPQEKFMELLDRLSFNLGTMLHIVQNNMRTQQLLEESMKQAEYLQQSEEELRQNMEELTATQEAMFQKEMELSGQLLAINNTMATVQYDMTGRVISANAFYSDLMGYKLREIEGKKHDMFVPEDEQAFNAQMWEKLRAGESFSGEFRRIAKDGKIKWIHATYTPVMGTENKPHKVIKFALDISQKKELSLDNQVKLQAIELSNLMAEFNTDGELVYANNNFLWALEYAKEEVLGKSFPFLAHSSTEQQIKAAWEEVQMGDFVKKEFGLLGKRGERVWLSGTLHPLMNRKGEMYKAILVGTDITKQRIVEQKANEERLRHRTTLEQCPDAVVMLDDEGIIQFFNEAATKLWKYPAEDVLGRMNSMLMPQDSQFTNFLVDPNNPNQRQFETKILTQKGNDVLCLVTLTEAHLASGKIYTAFIKNLTEKEQSAALLKKRQQDKAILDACLDAVVTTDHKGLIVYANPAAEQLWGYSLDELIGERVNLLMPGGTARVHDQYMDNYMKTRESKVIGKGREVLIQRKDGKELPAWLSLSETKTEDGLLFTAFMKRLEDIKSITQEKQHPMLLMQEEQILLDHYGRIIHISQDLLARDVNANQLKDRRFSWLSQEKEATNTLQAIDDAIAKVVAEGTPQAIDFQSRHLRQTKQRFILLPKKQNDSGEVFVLALVVEGD